MSIPEKCKRYFEKPLVPLCSADVFAEEEIQLLRKYGNWMKALMDGEIAPGSVEQERFVKVCRSEAEPLSLYERIWTRYLFRLKWEADPSNKLAMGTPRRIEEASFGGSREATKEMRRQQYGDMRRRSREE